MNCRIKTFSEYRESLNTIDVHGNPRQAVLFAYLAGLMDGEGTIRIDRVTKKGKNWNPIYNLHVSIGSVDEFVPDVFHKVFGVGSQRIERVPGKRPLYRWHVRGNRSARTIIENLLPYLVIKRERAYLALRFINEWKDRRNLRNVLELQRSEEAYKAMRKLNAVGAAASTERKSTREGEATVRTASKDAEENPKRSPARLSLVSRA